MLKKDIEGFNFWRTGANVKDVPLDLRNLNFPKEVSNPNLSGANLSNCDCRGLSFSTVNRPANLSNIDFRYSDLEGCVFEAADLSNCNFTSPRTHITEVNFNAAILDSTIFSGSNLAYSTFSAISKYDFTLPLKSSCKSTRFDECNLSGTEFNSCDLSKSIFSRALITPDTTFFDNEMDRHTDFSDTNFDVCRSSFSDKFIVKSNIRRNYWRNVCMHKPILKYPILLFFFLSDYGESTGRLIKSFLFF